MADHDYQSQGSKLRSPISTLGESRVIKKRNRIPVSCIPCQVRRSKCDRERPCSFCAKRGEAGKCSYSDSSKRSSISKSIQPFHDEPQNAQDRLKQLEDLVLSMIQTPSPSQYRPSSKVAEQHINGHSESTSQLKQQNGSHDGSSPDSGLPHWTAILDGIQELRSIIPDQSRTPISTNIPQDPLEYPVLLGSRIPISLSDILLRYLPSKAQLERRLTTYFTSTFMVLPIVHPRQFQRQFTAFCEAPLQTDPLWVALLFSILSLSALISLTRGQETDSSILDNFMAGAAQCINLEGYISPEKYLLEAILLLAQCKYMSSRDPSKETALLVPIATRLAYQSGLHREPPASTSPFEAEMRRRVWAMCKHFDVQLSCQFGVPATILPGCEDVQSPRNLQDIDLDENMEKLPPARPDNEMTPILTFVVKGRIMHVLSRIYQHALLLEPIPEEIFLTLDEQIRNEHKNIPTILKIRRISESFADSNNLIMSRMTCEFLVQKSICILHRKRMAAGDIRSRLICTEAAQIITRSLSDLYLEFQPNGRFHENRWLLTPTLLNDFLLATMILCLALSTTYYKTGDNQQELQFQLDSLQQAHDICVDLSNESRGARRVAEATAIILSNKGRSSNVMTMSSILPRPYHSNGDPNVVNKLRSDSTSINPISDQMNIFGNTINNDSILDVDWTAFDQFINTSAWVGP